MNYKEIIKRGKEHGYNSQSVDDISTMHEFIYRLLSFLQDSIDEEELPPEFVETAEKFIEEYDEGILEDLD